MNAEISLLINAVSAFVTSLQILQSLYIADYRQALAFDGDQAAAQRIILPCYRPLFVALIIMYLILALYQGLLLLATDCLQSSRFVLNSLKLYDLCILAIFSIVPVLLIQKSVSLRGFWRSFYLIFPLFASCCLILICLMLFSPSIEGIILLNLFFILIVSIPSISLSGGILLGYVHCRVRLKSVSNRNAIELMLTYACLYTVACIISTSVITSDSDSNPIAYSILQIFFVIISVVANALFSFALYRGLLADTKFWRGLGTHNQGGLSLDADSAIRHLRPTATSIDLKIASSSFQQMMSEISNICLDFAYVQIDRWIGTGSTSEVYCGRYNNVLVAVKISTPPEITVDVLQVFAHEAKTCSVLKHKNIVTFYGICVRPPQVGMVFELCEGGNLKGHLQKHAKRWNPALRVRACLQCAEAVAYLHSRGFIHRDLKAENFFVTRKMVVKLGDFGETSYKRNEESTENRKMTVLGTVTHMAPELITASKFYTESVDVYALAMTFVEIWTGLDPYQHLNHFQIYQEVMKGKRPDLPSDLPPELLDIIDRAWQQDYKRRPTADEVVEDLRALLYDMTGLSYDQRDASADSERSRGISRIDGGEGAHDHTEFTPRARKDPRSSSNFYVARLIMKARRFLHIQEDIIEEEDNDSIPGQDTEMVGQRRGRVISDSSSTASSNHDGARVTAAISTATDDTVAFNPLYSNNFLSFSSPASASYYINESDVSTDTGISTSQVDVDPENNDPAPVIVDVVADVDVDDKNVNDDVVLNAVDAEVKDATDQQV